MRKIKIIGTVLILISAFLTLNQVVFKTFDRLIINSQINSYYDSKNEHKDIYGVLEIEPLNINNIIYNYSSIQNDVNKNVYLVENSNTSQIILAAHSGESIKSYFKNLHLLNTEDVITFTKNNIVREYKLFNLEKVNKEGMIAVKKYNYPTLVLITCSKTDKNKQEIYYARLSKSYRKTQKN